MGLRQKIPCEEFSVIDVLGKLFCVFFVESKTLNCWTQRNHKLKKDMGAELQYGEITPVTPIYV